MPKIRFGPDGTHIFSRTSGSNILFDEVITTSDRWTKSPRQVSIALTNSCDLECTHCYAPKKPARLDIETVKQWMTELDKEGCFGIGFGGGEPMLYPNFLELCKFGRNNTNLSITMTSHGHLLTEPLIDSLKDSLNFLRVSMDGVNETYEKIRGRPFSTLLQKLNLLSSNIPYGINYVVNESTINDLPEAIKIAEKYRASEFLLLPEIAFGRGSAVKQKTLEQLSCWINEYKGDVQLSISSSHRELTNSQIPLPKEPEEIAFAHIDAFGVIKKSSFDETGEIIDCKGVLSAFNKLVSNRINYENME